MLFKLVFLISFGLLSVTIKAQTARTDFETIRIPSRIKGLDLALLHLKNSQVIKQGPILFIHGSSFPSALSAGFRMEGISWMDDLAQEGYDVYGLDFLGYGNSDRYKEMSAPPNENAPLGRAEEIYVDIDKAVDFLIRSTGSSKINIIAHSWGGSVAALYSQKFPDKVNKLVLYATIVSRIPQDQEEVVTGEESVAYKCLAAEKRIKLMKELTPENETSKLEKEIFTIWGQKWLDLSTPYQKNNSDTICYPDGSSSDVKDLITGQGYFNPGLITASTLIIRGEWDAYPSFTDAHRLFESLEKAAQKRYIIIEKGTHVLHLEKNRFQLYEEVRLFLNH